MTDLLIDGNSLYARAWFATMGKTAGPAMAKTSYAGRVSPKEAIKASLNTVLSLLNVNNDKLGERVDRILFGWDGDNKPQAELRREAKPKEYYATRELLVEYLTLLLNPAHVRLDAHTADDVVATAVKQSDADSIFVISGDKDLQQLAGGRVQYYCLNKKMLLSERAIKDKWHVKHPSQVAIALAIIGDKVDGIPGVNGWGPVKVKKLFQEIPDGLALEEVVLALEPLIPAQSLDGFYNDLVLTLLEPNLEGVPPAAPIAMAKPEVVEELRLDGLMEFYQPVYRLYHGHGSRPRLDADGDEEDAPKAPLLAKARPQRGSSSALRRTR